MNTKRFIISVVASFIYLLLFDFVLHGILLQDIYQQTAHLWRAPEEMQNFMPYMTLSQLLFSLMTAFIFTRNYEGKGLGEGIRYGALVGLLIASLQIGTYSYMPIPFTLVVIWTVGYFVWGIGAGIVLALTYKK